MSVILEALETKLLEALAIVQDNLPVWPMWDTAGVANSPTFTNNGRTVEATSTSGHILRSNIGFTAERRQGEIVIEAGSAGYLAVGLITSSQSIASPPTSLAAVPAGAWLWRSDQYKVNSGSYSAFGSSYTTGDRIQIVMDENGALWFGKNDFYNGNPASGTGAAFTGLTGELALCVSFMGSTGSPRVTIAQGMTNPLSGFALWGE